MGDFRTKHHENVRETKERSSKTIEQGKSMEAEGREIESILESIDLADSEDIQAIRDTNRAYDQSFETAFEDDIESAGEEIQEQSSEIAESVGDELGEVRSGIGKLEKAGSVSEIGREAAEAGESKLEGSAREYEQIMEDAKEVSSDMAQQIQDLKNRMGSIFK